MSDANRGSYLSPEPLLQSPTWVTSQLRRGRQVPAYSYALNNPIRYVDRNGLNPGAAAAGFYFVPWSSAAAAAAGWGAAAASVGATAAGAAVGAGVFAAANAGIGMFHDPPAGIPYPPVGAPALPHPADEPGVGDVPIPAPVCMAGPRVPKECRDNYKQCRQAGGRWTSLLQCEYCKTRCIDLGYWPWPAAGGISGMEVCNYTGPYEAAE